MVIAFFVAYLYCLITRHDGDGDGFREHHQ